MPRMRSISFRVSSLMPLAGSGSWFSGRLRHSRNCCSFWARPFSRRQARLSRPSWRRPVAWSPAPQEVPVADEGAQEFPALGAGGGAEIFAAEDGVFGGEPAGQGIGQRGLGRGL